MPQGKRNCDQISSSQQPSRKSTAITQQRADGKQAERQQDSKLKNGKAGRQRDHPTKAGGKSGHKAAPETAWVAVHKEMFTKANFTW